MRRRSRSRLLRSPLSWDPRATLYALSAQMAAQDRSLVPRVVPDDADFRQWEHYPVKDAISPSTGARWFYHAHPPEQRAPGEHGHFHLFLPLASFDGIEPVSRPAIDDAKKAPAQVVHIAALSCNTAGEPTHWFTTNRWVTEEYMMPASEIIARIDGYDVRDAPGDALVNGWMTAAVAMFREPIAAMLDDRDAALAGGQFDDRDREILSTTAFNA